MLRKKLTSLLLVEGENSWSKLKFSSDAFNTVKVLCMFNFWIHNVREKSGNNQQKLIRG